MTRLLLALLLAGAWPARAQTPVVLDQDDLDFQGRSSLVLGAGARALGMAGAFLARADDATAASWNPAGLSYLRRPEVTLVGSRNLFDTKVDALDGSLVSNDSFRGRSPDFAAVTFPVELGRASGAVQMSYQRTFSFFSGERSVELSDAPSRRLVGGGGFDVISAGSGLQLLRRLRIGATLNRWVNGFEQDRERLVRRRTQQEVRFDLSGWNTNLGLLWSPTEDLNIGLVGRTPFTGEVRLTRRRTDVVSGEEGEPDAQIRNFAHAENVRLDFPGAVGAGVSWRPSNPITLCVDYTRTFWSDAMIRNYYTLPTTGAPAPPTSLFPELPFPSLSEKQVDTAQIRVGAEYVWFLGRLKLPLRAGYLSDGQFFKVASGKAPRFDGIAFGTGLALGDILLDAAYFQEFGRYSATEDTRTRVKIRRFFVSLIYRYGSR